MNTDISISPSMNSPNCCLRMSVCLRRSRWFPFTARTAQPLIHGWLAVARAVQSQALGLILVNIFRIGERGEHDFLRTPLAQRVTGGFRCLSIFGAAVSTYFFMDSIREIWSITHYAEARRQENKFSQSEDRKDAVLTLLSSAAGMLDSSASFALALAQAGAITSTSVIWAPYVAMAASALFCFTIWGHWRNIHHGKDILQTLGSERPLEWLDEKLRDETLGGKGAFYLRELFEIIYREKFQVQISHIICEGNQMERDKLVRLLSSRITDKISSHKLKIISLTISILATFLLYLGPMFWGFGLLGVAASLAFIAYVKDRCSIYRLEKSINEMRALDTIASDWIKSNFLQTYNCLPIAYRPPEGN